MTRGDQRRACYWLILLPLTGADQCFEIHVLMCSSNVSTAEDLSLLAISVFGMNTLGQYLRQFFLYSPVVEGGALFTWAQFKTRAPDSNRGL